MCVGASVPCGFFVQVFDLLNNQKRLKVWEDGKQQVQMRWEGVGVSSVAVGVCPCIAVMVCSIYCLIPPVCT